MTKVRLILQYLRIRWRLYRTRKHLTERGNGRRVTLYDVGLKGQLSVVRARLLGMPEPEFKRPVVRLGGKRND